MRSSVCMMLLRLDLSPLHVCQFFLFFLCVVIKPENPFFTSRSGSRVNVAVWLWQGRAYSSRHLNISIPPLHLEAPVWQHARCTKATEQAQVYHAWQKKYHEHAVATRKVFKNLQQERFDGEGTGYMGDNTCQKTQEAQYNLDPGSFFVNRF